MVAASPQLVFNPDQDYSLAVAEFDRFMDYQFENGDVMHVQQKGHGMRGENVNFEVLFNGRTPQFHVKVRLLLLFVLKSSHGRSDDPKTVFKKSMHLTTLARHF